MFNAANGVFVPPMCPLEAIEEKQPILYTIPGNYFPLRYKGEHLGHVEVIDRYYRSSLVYRNPIEIKYVI